MKVTFMVGIRVHRFLNFLPIILLLSSILFYFKEIQTLVTREE